VFVENNQNDDRLKRRLVSQSQRAMAALFKRRTGFETGQILEMRPKTT
jgi:hypothetical protein